MNKEPPVSGVIKYEGPELIEGLIGAQEVASAILGLQNAFKKLSPKKKEWTELKPVLKVKFHKGSLEIIGIIVATAIVADRVGLTEFSKSFFGEMGKQLAIRKFSKGNDVTKVGPPRVENGKMYTAIRDIDGNEILIPSESYELYKNRTLEKEIAAIVGPIEPKKINSLKYTYPSDDKSETIKVSAAEKSFFEENTALETDVSIELEEDFNDAIAEDIPPLSGKLVAYQALALKYPFYFQPRESQKMYGKKFIPCMLADEKKRDDYIELMKTQHSGNLIITGKGIKDESGAYRLIKIESVEEDKPLQLFGD